MDERDIRILNKIADHARRAVNYAEKYSTPDDFSQDSKTVEACVFNIMQIGELAKQSLSSEAKMEINLPWNQIYGLRNRIVHGYADIQMTIVFDVIKNDLPEVIAKVDKAIIKKS